MDGKLSNLRRVGAYWTRVYTAYHVTRLYVKGIYAPDERHAMILVFLIETFIFTRA